MDTVYRNSKNEVLYAGGDIVPVQPAVAWNTVRRESFPFWDLRLRQYQADGIQITACKAEVYEPIRITTSREQPMPGMVVMQRGEVTTTAFSGGGPRRYRAHQHNFFVNPYMAEESIFNKQHIEAVLITFSPERFLELAAHGGPAMAQLAGFVEGKPYAQQENLPVTPRMQALIDEILQCRYAGGWQHLYLQAKALELLALQCQQLENTANKPRGLRPGEIGKIYQAREALLCDIQHPPSLTSLARIAGLNEYKLKTGFKEVFGNTVFGYLKDHRLTLARQLLEGGGKTATEVAYETGYSTLQHFSNEFKRKFGISPGKLGGK